MKRSDLKELIKKSMLEVSPNSGAMTPEEEEMVAGYEEEEANKYALDKEEPLEEALNKDIKAFGQDLGKYLTNAGFKVKFINGGISNDDLNQVKTNTGLVALEADQNPSQQSLYLHFNPKEVGKVEKIVEKFQLSPYDGKVMTKGWTSKQVTGAVNPGDIFKIDSDKLRGIYQFFRLAQVDTKVKSMEEDILREADEIVAAWAQKQTIKEALDFPRDAVQALKDAYKNIEKIYSTFGRDFRFKDVAKQEDYLMIKAILESINDKLMGYDPDFSYGDEAELGYDTLNEEMHGGYLELLEMNPSFDEGVAKILEAWNEWKEGDMTEPFMVEEAKEDVLAYLSSMMS